MAPLSAVSAAAPESVEDFSGDRPIVLVVDDEPINCALVAGILSERFEVIVARSGVEAIEQVSRRRVHLAIVDIYMPGMDGIDTTAGLKAQAGGHFLPVILMTASNDEARLSQGLASGADDFITKPFSRVLLEEKIAVLLRTSAVFEILDEQNRELAAYRASAERAYDVVRRVLDRAVRSSPTGLPDVFVGAVALERFNGDLVVSAFAGPVLRLLIGDFAGHGLGAAVGALPMTEVFYAMTARNIGLELVVRELNSKLHRMLPRDLFLSACLVDVDLAAERIRIWNAGLPDVLVVGPDGETRYWLPSLHPPLGVLPSPPAGSALVEVPFARGSRLAIFSDGFIEARRDDGASFGVDRVEARLVAPGTGNDWAAELWKAQRHFAGSAPSEDDVTFLGLTHTPALADVLARAAEGRRQAEVAADKSIVFTYGPAELRTLDPLAPLLGVVEALPRLARRASEIKVIVTELFVNSVEHGLLGLDSSIKDGPGGFEKFYGLRQDRLAALGEGSVTVRLEVGPFIGEDTALITVTDTGPGFSFEAPYPSGGGPKKAGRGLTIVRQLSCSMSILDGGRTVRVVLSLDPTHGK